MNTKCPYQILAGTDIRIYNKLEGKGRVRNALFDFDGTLSLLRRGWEIVMEDFMLKAICNGTEPRPEIVEDVRSYIDASTGSYTINQMKALTEMVRRYGMVPEGQIKNEWDYKGEYCKLLKTQVKGRLARLSSGEKTPADFMVKGAPSFCPKLRQRGVVMHLASGTDSDDVFEEADALQLSGLFGGNIHGATPSMDETKGNIIKRLVRSQNSGSELVVFGDGPVEIADTKRNGAIAVGVASDETTGSGYNLEKIRRLTKAGCDILIPDFSCGEELIEYLIAHS